MINTLPSPRCFFLTSSRPQGALFFEERVVKMPGAARLPLGCHPRIKKCESVMVDIRIMYRW
ncbi:hypothetical protein M413DRAFT_389083 [Hebeloma cylindrosporum]|uniref:Uncharacterized protein n=1 Tax=Hebeloma cylindrosporum TaxID=76867 RepID=A0A0C3CJA9_HEBCY|nr:hypothetical protein M413DRAFT_389083 [Hebeloma cylindrosporum h7]